LTEPQGGIASDLSLALGSSTIRLISGWRDWHNRQSEADIPYTQARLFGRDAEYRSRSHSEELQFVSPSGGALSAVGGLYYFRERYQVDTIINFGADYCSIYIRNTAPARVAACLAAPQRGAGTFAFDQVTTSLAAYGQATYRLTSEWDVTGGLRYSHDDKGGDLLSVAANPLVAGLNAPDRADLSFDGGRVTYRINTTYRPIADVMLFATVSTGYKSGGFDTGTGNTLGNARVFAPETVTNYEIGAKTQFLDRRLTLNATLFRMDVDDFQLRSFNGTFYVVRNAGSIRQQGVEFDISARPVNGLTLSLSGTRLASKYTDFRNAPPRPGLTGVQDLTGARVSYSPKWQGTAAVDYSRQLASGYRLGANAHLGFNSDIDVGIAGDGNPQGVQSEYALLGGRLSFTLPDDRWELALLGENLTDKGYCVTQYGMTLAAGLGLAAGGQTVMRCVLGEPRTIRGSVSLRF
jgi:iron complex outermembrane receptor protein